MMRRRYSNSFKLKTVKDIIEETEQAENPISIRQTCRNRNMAPKMYRMWSHQHVKIASNKRSAYKIHPGRKSSISAETEDLILEWIMMKRESGSHVNYNMLQRAISKLDQVFRNKSKNAKRLIVRRLSKRNKYVYRASTHTAQRPPIEVRNEAQEFVMETAPRLATSFYGHRCKDYIINMDQTPVFFSFGSKSTLDLIGTRSIGVTGTPHLGSTSRATCFLSCTASGKMMTPLVVFKGTEFGSISRELSTYQQGALYQCQIKAWCDKRVMLFWVNNVLGPYVHEAPPDVRPVLLLDRYSCHIMDEVVDLIYAMGVEIIHVPGGCTSLAQPLDVGINKPFKDRIRKKWEIWVDYQKTKHGENHTPKVPRELVARWIVKSNRDINETIAKNAWMHAPFNYFAFDE